MNFDRKYDDLQLKDAIQTLEKQKTKQGMQRIVYEYGYGCI